YVRDGNFELLYDLERDPGERLDLGYRHPEKLRDLRAAVAGWEADLARNPPPHVVK
ncbi:MAG: hypothetical protein HYZ57_13010, partial [Acidobacteria bacterium]|nr:hypothetical protein [Acidobacteriota bacterium]MBI3280750.1 hypothetical protein [Acidobacteriota bacterium]